MHLLIMSPEGYAEAEDLVNQSTTRQLWRRALEMLTAFFLHDNRSPRNIRDRKPYRPPELAVVGFAARREKIQKAFTQTVREDERQDELSDEKIHHTYFYALVVSHSKKLDTQKNLLMFMMVKRTTGALSTIMPTVANLAISFKLKGHEQGYVHN